jgi:hypothetical protein
MIRRHTAHSPDSPAAGGTGSPTTPVDYLNDLFDRSASGHGSGARIAAAGGDVPQGLEKGLIQLILHAARHGPRALRRPWGHAVVEVFAPSAAGQGAIALRIVPSSLWNSAQTDRALGDLSDEDCIRWLRPTAWALARRFLPRGVLLANLAIARWRPCPGELFALAVLDGPFAAEVCIDLELTFVNEHLPTILASLRKELSDLRRTTRNAPLAAEVA